MYHINYHTPDDPLFLSGRDISTPRITMSNSDALECIGQVLKKSWVWLTLPNANADENTSRYGIEQSYTYDRHSEILVAKELLHALEDRVF